MALSPMNFQILSPDQANPILYGMGKGAAIAGQQQANIGQGITNAMNQAKLPYVGQMARQQLVQSELQNALSQNTLNYAPATSRSDIALKNAQATAQNALPSLYSAQARDALSKATLTYAQSKLLNAQTPYLVQQQQEKLYSDPIMSRLYQMGLAQKTNAISPDLLGTITGNGGVPSPSGTPPQVANTSNLIANPNNAIPATAPKAFSGNGFTNWALFDNPYNPIQYAAAQKSAVDNASTSVASYKNYQTEASKDADIANQTINLLHQFDSNYQNANYKGSTFGELPVKGLMSGLVPGNLSAEQGADNASQNIAATIAKLVAGGRVTNYEMQYISNLKPNRSMTPQTEQMAVNFLNAKMTRLKEQQQFLNAAKSQGVDPQTASTLWQNYETQRPVYDFQSGRTNTNFQGDWKSFLNPNAVAAAQNGQSYVSMPSFHDQTQFQNWYKTLPQDVQQQVKIQIAQRGKYWPIPLL